MKKLRSYLMFGLFAGLVWAGNMQVQAKTIYTSPYVTFAPDGQAWTTDAGNTNVKWYKEDGTDDVFTGVKSSLEALKTGQHYYKVRRTGAIPVSEWQVQISAVNCCHNVYPQDGEYHGIDFVMQNCYKPHFSAWYPKCADCGNVIVPCNFYMSKEAAQSLHYIEIGNHMSYYYLCPFNRNLEQGASFAYHTCHKISANRYRIVYEANAGEEDYSGYMAPSFHMYDNATEYEGNVVTPQMSLNPNRYARIGWEFVGWNTAPDGRGTFYEDRAEILNLCAEDYLRDQKSGTVYLYAVWKPTESALEINPNGGSFEGSFDVTRMYGKYGASIHVASETLVPPAGYEVSFDVCGGQKLESVRGTRKFTQWLWYEPFHGTLKGDRYTFYGPDGGVDQIIADYSYEAIVLPAAVRENYSFGGWYYDAEYQKPVGTAGDLYVPLRDVTLYAQWVALVLSSEENYETEQAGAVDLEWNQPDGQDKSYKLYQCVAGGNWQQVYEQDDIQSNVDCSIAFGCNGREQKWVVPFSGFYQISAYGAQGGNYGDYEGGKGGFVQGRFWLDKGWVLNISVGGSDGYPNGGDGEEYSYGGGASSVSLADKTQQLFVVAGGGGGAGSCGDGGDGGLNVGLVEIGYYGESGPAGGGGGYVGGKAGLVEVHNHIEGKCNHVHEGTPSIAGGCYTEKIVCGAKLTHIHTRTEEWYWGGSDEQYCPNCGADASKGETCSGHTTKYYKHECDIHGKQASNTSSSSPSKCKAVLEYGLGCGRTEEYFCGYPYDGYVISSEPAYGGSSYVNTEMTESYIQEPGVREGNGYVLIEAEDVGYRQDHALEGVSAPDMASPRAVDVATVQKEPVSEGIIRLLWDEPQDLGTVYYHRAHSYAYGSNQCISVSNITADTMVSGIKGYLIRQDQVANTEITPSNASFVATPKSNFLFTYADQYAHIRVVDYAGNYSETVHIPLGSRSEGSEGVKWPIRTRTLTVKDDEYVHRADGYRTFYVRVGNNTAFTLQYEAYIEGTASNNYQINHAILESNGMTQEVIRNDVLVPRGSVTDEEYGYEAQDLGFVSDGEGYWRNGDYTTATRSSRCQNLSVTRQLAGDEQMHGKTIMITPIAGADTGAETVYSDYSKDKGNALWLIGDGQAPVFTGLDVLEELSLLDRREGERILELSVSDEISGVREWSVEIENMDNGAKQVFHPGAEEVLVLNICEDEPIFSGDFTVKVSAADNVGNETTMSYGTTEFDLQVCIERILSPHDPIFKKGESGYLYITCWGYPERIEIEFPKEMTDADPDLNHVYEYPLKGSYMQEEQYEFCIPLSVPDGADYTVTVRAYKGDKMLEKYPALAVIGVNGSIVDDIRTRLR